MDGEKNGDITWYLRIYDYSIFLKNSGEEPCHILEF